MVAWLQPKNSVFLLFEWKKTPPDWMNNETYDRFCAKSCKGKWIIFVSFCSICSHHFLTILFYSALSLNLYTSVYLYCECVYHLCAQNKQKKCRHTFVNAIILLFSSIFHFFILLCYCVAFTPLIRCKKRIAELFSTKYTLNECACVPQYYTHNHI